MKSFDLKRFREINDLTQYQFAERLDYGQALISRMETGGKKVSDNILMKIESEFNLNLDNYKKYDKNKKGMGEPFSFESEEPMMQPFHHDQILHSELERKYLQLLEDKSRIDDKYYALSEEHKVISQELVLIKENNAMLKQVLANTDKILSKMITENN